LSLAGAKAKPRLTRIVLHLAVPCLKRFRRH
jgi:hypothetical protein